MTIALLALIAALGAEQLPPRDTSGAAAQGTGVLRGIVVDAQTGGPLPRATVSIAPERGPNSRGMHTDGDGRFEFRGLPAGKYYLRVDRMPYVAFTWGQREPNSRGTPIELHDGQVVERLRVALQPGGVITGHVVDEYGFPAVNVRVQPMQYRYESGERRLSQAFAPMSPTTDDRGAFRVYGLAPGTYYLSAHPHSIQATPRLVTNVSGPIVTYFPNTPDPDGAQRIAVAAGKEVAGITITLASGRLARLRGRALMSNGEPFIGASIMIAGQDGNSSSFGGTFMKPDGSFEISGVPAGQYTLTAQVFNSRHDPADEVARTRVTVNGDDVDDIVLVARRGATLRGVILLEQPDTSVKPAQLHVMVTPDPRDRNPHQPAIRVRDDLTFEMTGLFGRARVEAAFMSEPRGTTAMGPPDGAQFWAVKAVYWRGEDVTTRFLDFDSQQHVDGIEIVFSNRWAELTGTVTDQTGQVVADAPFVIFPEDETQWQNSRRVRPVRTSSEGTFRVPGLFGGDYLMAPTPVMEQGQWGDPDFLRSLVERATRVSVADGEKQTVNLRITSQ